MTSSPPARRSRAAHLFLSFREHRVVHYSVTAIVAAGLLFLYYAHRQSLPAPANHYLEWFWDIFYFEFKNHVLGVLMLVPILYAATTLGWKRSSLVVIALLIAIAPYVYGFAYSSRTLFESFSLLAIPPALIIAVEMLLISVSNEKRARDAKKRERAEIMRQTFSIQENERLRISRDLHDSVAQTLLVNASTAHSMLESKKRDGETFMTALESIKQNSLSMVAEIRCICQDLRPSVLDNLGLVSSIKWLVDDLSEQTGKDIELTISGVSHELNQDENVAVFRLVQEALNNIKKHSDAEHVAVDVTYEQTSMSIVIRDDGKGFELPDDVHQYALSGKLGILGMHERAQSVGASLRVDSKLGLGTKVSIRLDEHAPAETDTM